MYIDENGDAAGNYTILSIKGVSDNSSTVFGLYPIGTFSVPDGNQIPVGCIMDKFINSLPLCCPCIRECVFNTAFADF